MTTEIFQSQCQIFKRISGKWLGGCGFLDGEKLICMDGLYEDVITNNCLVYSFGVGKYDLKVSKSQKQILKFSFEPKNERKYFCISALASKKRSNQNNKGILYH